MQWPVGRHVCPDDTLESTIRRLDCQTVCDACVRVPELGQMSFQQLLDRIGQDRFDRTTGTGHIILSIPGRMAARSAIDVIGIGDDVTEAKTRVAQFVGRISHEGVNMPSATMRGEIRVK